MRALLPVLSLPLVLAGCGWHAGLAAPEGRTVGVEVFETRRGLLQRELEPELSDALTRAVTDLVAAPLASPSRADVVVRGTILDYHRRSGIRSTGNQIVETGLKVAVSAELVDREGRVLATSQPHVWSGYALDADVTSQESEARQRSLRHLAETIVLDLFGTRAEASGAPEEAPGVEEGEAPPL